LFADYNPQEDEAKEQECRIGSVKPLPLSDTAKDVMDITIMKCNINVIQQTKSCTMHITQPTINNVKNNSTHIRYDQHQQVHIVNVKQHAHYSQEINKNFYAIFFTYEVIHHVKNVLH